MSFVLMVNIRVATAWLSSHHHHHHHHLWATGSCITTVKPGEVCSLVAVSTECDENLAATTCTCDEGYQYSNASCTGQ